MILMIQMILFQTIRRKQMSMKKALEIQMKMKRKEMRKVMKNQ